jgi:hypothetical protein
VTLDTEASVTVISGLHERKPRWSHSLEKASKKIISLFEEAVELTRVKSAAEFCVYRKDHKCFHLGLDVLQV